MIDPRISWTLRFLLYRLINPKIKGIGYIGKPLSIIGFHNISLGNQVGIFPGVRIDAKYGQLNIAGNTKIGHNAFFDCASDVTIGSHVTISANVFIGTAAFKPSPDPESTFKDWQTRPKQVIIEDNVFIGFGAMILPGSWLKRGAVIGAHTIISGIIESGEIISSASKGRKRNRFK